MADLQETLGGLFTEIAILEHLTRTRVERNYMAGDLQPWHFGILNYFIRNHPGPDSIAGIAWAFQDDETVVGERVADLEARGWVSVSPGARPGDAMVEVTDAGREKHRDQLDEIAPDFVQLVAEIPLDRLENAHEVLREIRLTMDNLPDR